MAEAVRVVARFRPPNEYQAKTRGGDGNAEFGLKFPDEKTVSILCPQHAGHNEYKPFYFDYVFPYTATQEDVFEQVATASLKDIFAGYNACIFTYGQTGSGKSHTMMGPKGCHHIELDENGVNINPAYPQRGLIPRIAESLFQQMSQLEDVLEVNIACSYLEIYREQVRDLLNANSNSSIGLKVREAPTGECFVENLTEEFVSDTNEILNLIKHGEKHRTVAATQMNEVSSRSHSVLIIVVTQKCADGSVKTGKLNLADLAGSERVLTTGASGTTLEEAKMINKSLSALGNCISALTEKGRKHVPYRDSTLSFLLKDSLGGNTKTTLIINCSSDSYNGPETISTLRFGARAKQVKNAAKINRQRSVAELELIISNIRKEMDTQTKYIVLLKALITEMFLNNIQIENQGKILTLLNFNEIASHVSGASTLNETSRKILNSALDLLLDFIKEHGNNVKVSSNTAKLPDTSALTATATPTPAPTPAPASTAPPATTATGTPALTSIKEDGKVSNLNLTSSTTTSTTPTVDLNNLPVVNNTPRVSVALLQAIKPAELNTDDTAGWGNSSDEDEEHAGWGGSSSDDDDDPESSPTTTMPMKTANTPRNLSSLAKAEENHANEILIAELKHENEEKSSLVAQQTMKIRQLEANMRDYESDIKSLKEKLEVLQRKEQMRLEEEISCLKNNTMVGSGVGTSSSKTSKSSSSVFSSSTDDDDIDVSETIKSDIEKIDITTLRTKLGKALAQESALRNTNAELEARIEQMKRTWSSYLDIVLDTAALTRELQPKGPRIIKPQRATRRSYVAGSITPLRSPNTTPMTSPNGRIMHATSTSGTTATPNNAMHTLMSPGSTSTTTNTTQDGMSTPTSSPALKRMPSMKLPSLADLSQMDTSSTTPTSAGATSSTTTTTTTTNMGGLPTLKE